MPVLSLRTSSNSQVRAASSYPSQASSLRGDGRDFAFVAVIWIAMIIGVIRKNDKYTLWFDELLSFNLITDPSLSHMLRALGDQADGGAPVYYILARLWAQVFGATEISLRLFSTLCFGIGATVLWILLRRLFPRWIAALAISCALGSSTLVRFEAANVRFYGLIFALFSIGLFIAYELLRSERPNRLLLLSNFAVNAILVLTHPFGLCYSGLLMLGVAAADWVSYHRLRLNIAVSYIAAWSALLLWLNQFIRQADLNNPFTWIRRPGWFELTTYFDAGGDYGSIVVLVLILVLFQRRGSVGQTPLGRDTIGLSIISVTSLAIIPVFWAFSRAIPDRSIFLDRYFVGCIAGWAIILGCLLASIGHVSRRVKVATAAVSVLMLTPLMALYKEDLPERRDATVSDVDIVGAPRLPILMLNAQWFLVRHRYGPENPRYFYPLDWQAMLKDNPRKKPIFDAPTNFKLMSGLRRNYSEYRNIIPIEEFLAREPQFLVYGLNKEWRALRLPSAEYDVRLADPAIVAERQPEYFLVQRRKLPTATPSAD